MRRTLTFAVLLAMLAAVCGCGPKEVQYYRVDNGKIMLGDVPQYFIGTNMWYAVKLGGGDETQKTRLRSELDSLHAIGVNNLRILAAEPEWEGLDYTLDELQKRGMSAVLFMNNAWNWSKGYADYVREAEEKFGSEQEAEDPAYDVKGAPGQGVQQAPRRRWRPQSAFITNKHAQELYWDFVKEIVSRYKDHPAIFSWQLCNEPRCFSKDPTVQDQFVEMISNTAKLIKGIDSNHMVSTGSEGEMGCENNMRLCIRINQIPEIDYVNIHIWPFNWGWIKADSVAENYENAERELDRYLDAHLRISAMTGKPLIVEEFGYPRDGFVFKKGTPTTYRDRLYAHMFGRIIGSARSSGFLAGCNFWAWSGLAEQAGDRYMWQEGDDYAGDPAMEQQGLNSVYLADRSTIKVIKDATEELRKVSFVEVPVEHEWLWLGDTPYVLNAEVSNTTLKKDEIGIKVLKDIGLVTEPVTALEATAPVKFRNGKGKVSFDISSLEPGFYQVSVGGGKPFNIGIRPEEISSPQDKQPDFDEFWDRTLKELAEVAPEYEMTLMPENSNEQRNVYKVQFKSLGGALMGGYYCEPVKEGKYPSKIEYMGYGAEPYIFDPSSEPETIQFLVSVRGQGIFLGTTPRDWDRQGLADKETYYYRGAYADVVRAIDFIASREKCDPDRIYAQGESQGGAFTWIAASLDNRIAAAAPAVPFLGDFPHYAQIVGWPMGEILEAARNQDIPEEELYKTLSYFDVKNFTDRIKCPLYMSFGLQDSTCPPHTEFAAYNQVRSEKAYFCVPLCGHAMWQQESWTKERMEWFDAMIKSE